MKRLIAVSLILIIGLSALVSGCSSTDEPATTETNFNYASSGPGVHYIPTGTIFFEELPDIGVAYKESVEVQITFTNFDSAARTIESFPPEIKIESRNRTSVDDIARTFSAGDEQIELQPGESRQYTLVWNQQNDSGQQVPYGWYGIRANMSSRVTTDTTSTQGSEGQVMRVLVSPPGGAMEKSLEPGLVQASGDVLVKVEMLEMTSTGARLQTLAVPENYDSSDVSAGWIDTEAEYKIDDGDWKPAKKDMFGTLQLKEGVRYIFDLDPVPADTRQLTLRITEIGKKQGLWEFEIPLDG